jgi:hypothetical protein
MGDRPPGPIALSPESLLLTEALMRISSRPLVLSLALSWSAPSVVVAQAAPSHTPPSATADDIPVSIRWNRLVPALVDEALASRQARRLAAAGDSAALRRIAQAPPPILFRVYTLLGVAQHAAAHAASSDHAVSPSAAIASASAVVLAELFADSAVRSTIARTLAKDLEAARSGAGAAARISAGERMGESVARRVIAWAPPVNFGESWTGAVPTGPGMWRSAPGVPPMGIFLARSHPWILDSASQFRPAPPPAFGSPAHDAALAEVQRVARERTPEQTKVARRWNRADPWEVWNDVASAALLRQRVPEADAARVLAVLNVAASDAVIACFEAKYHYWTIRPSQVDTALVLPDSVSLPNFPSFPSGHACSAGAFGEVLAHYLPNERAEFTRMAEEQAMSRLYGGIHYRFDNEVGLALGRTVARYAVERERNGGLSPSRVARVDREP